MTLSTAKLRVRWRHKNIEALRASLTKQTISKISKFSIFYEKKLESESELESNDLTKVTRQTRFALTGGNFTFMNGEDAHQSWFYGPTANVVPEQALDFYRVILGQHGVKEQGMGAFEVHLLVLVTLVFHCSNLGLVNKYCRLGLNAFSAQSIVLLSVCPKVDFLNYNFGLYPRFRSEPHAHAQWLAGMDQAAQEANVSIQYCMALPQQMLNSVRLQTVTSARVSGDGGRFCKCHLFCSRAD